MKRCLRYSCESAARSGQVVRKHSAQALCTPIVTIHVLSNKPGQLELCAESQKLLVKLPEGFVTLPTRTEIVQGPAEESVTPPAKCSITIHRAARAPGCQASARGMPQPAGNVESHLVLESGPSRQLDPSKVTTNVQKPPLYPLLLPGNPPKPDCPREPPP